MTNPSNRSRGQYHGLTSLGAVVLIAAIAALGLFSVTNGLLSAQPSEINVAGTPAASPGSSPAASPQASPAAATTSKAVTPDSKQSSSPLDDGADKVIQIIRGTTSGDSRVARVPLSQKHVYDPYQLIKSSDETSLEKDARYLQTNGIPSLIYIRKSDADRADSQQYADSLRDTWDIESAPNADDGLVILVTMGVRSPRNGTVVFSYGKNTFPVNGLDVNRLNQIYNDNMLPSLAKGQIYSGLYVSVRLMSYYAVFTPGAPPALDSQQKDVSSIVKIAAPVGTILTLVPLIAFWFYPRFADVFGERRRKAVRWGWLLVTSAWVG
ncbi:MAG TPA: TPM domain-containing protein, partial [Thermomicrobiales bacterium]|nr:TPM domain-containing protein [Thermomicrobiales bacterium]